jgi:hypothetical protein
MTHKALVINGIAAAMLMCALGAVALGRIGESHALSYAQRDVQSAATAARAPWLPKEIGLCVVDKTASTGWVTPWNARASGRLVATACLGEFSAEVLPFLPAGAILRVELTEADASLRRDKTID